MTTLFVRHSYAGRLRAAYRRHRATPHRGLTAPLVLATSLAVGGHFAAARAEAPGPAAPVDSAVFLAARPDHRLQTLLGEATDVAAPARPLGGSVFARTLDRASRSEARVAVAPAATRPKPKPARKPAPPRKPRWARPTGGPLTSPFGSRWGRMHNGLDFGAPYGSPVRAAFDGVITFAAFDAGGYGKQVRIRHANGVVTTYSHMSKIVVTGGRVKAGQVVGRIGSTGNSTGPHLHFEVLVGGANVNPRPFLAARGVRV